MEEDVDAVDVGSSDLILLSDLLERRGIEFV